ncbi:hypothetical protein [Streptomyces sp. NBC_00212]
MTTALTIVITLLLIVGAARTIHLLNAQQPAPHREIGGRLQLSLVCAPW